MTPSSLLTFEPRRLAGRTVSAIGAGCWTIGGSATNRGVPIGWDGVDPDKAYAALEAAAELGVNFFDTADVYGLGASERLLGRLLKRLLTQLPRKDVVISSKVGYFAGTAAHPYAPMQMRHQLETTLTNLGLDRLDVYFLHSADFGPGDRYLGAAAEQMRAFQEEGLIGAVGMRAPHAWAQEWAEEWTVSSELSGRAGQARRFLHLFFTLRPKVLAVRHNLLSRRYHSGETDVFEFAAAHDVEVIIKQPLAQGLLTGSHTPDLIRNVSSSDHRSIDPQFQPAVIRAVHEALADVAAFFSFDRADLVRVALRYALQHAPQAPVLVGFRDAAQISMNLTCLGAPLTSDEVTLLRNVTEEAARVVDSLPRFRPGTWPIPPTLPTTSGPVQEGHQ
ncbi:aldo/keto reductase [Streptosporangium sp. NPDC002524]|uniref:aldo/keto reductase n=1 Tax=Streptosporangium sp. NPDC002524 TaxID=3154537 RepID=UPI003328A8BB